MLVTVPAVGVVPDTAMVIDVLLGLPVTVTVPTPVLPVPAVAAISSPISNPMLVVMPVMVAVKEVTEPEIEPTVPVAEMVCVVGVNRRFQAR